MDKNQKQAQPARTAKLHIELGHGVVVDGLQSYRELDTETRLRVEKKLRFAWEAYLKNSSTQTAESLQETEAGTAPISRLPLRLDADVAIELSQPFPEFDQETRQRVDKVMNEVLKALLKSPHCRKQLACFHFADVPDYPANIF